MFAGGSKQTSWRDGEGTRHYGARINPRDAYHFTQANRQLAKTDRLDAHGLRRFGEQLKPARSGPSEFAAVYCRVGARRSNWSR